MKRLNFIKLAYISHSTYMEKNKDVFFHVGLVFTGFSVKVM